MYSITTSVRGPERQRTFVQRLIGRSGNDIYYLKPRLYQEDLSFPLETFGTLMMKTGHREIDSKEMLEARVNEVVKEYIGNSVPIIHPSLGMSLFEIPVEQIQFRVERFG